MIGETGIWSKELAEGTHVWSEKLAAAMCTILDKNIALWDLGCGKGYYTEYFRNKGIKAIGIDGTEWNIQPEYTIKWDLSTKLPVRDYGGNSICLEVGEHVPVEYEQALLDNIAIVCSNRLVLSWAIPDQIGIGHVNCREQGYIIDEIQRRGFKLNDKHTEYLRQNVDDHTSWFRDTILVFDKI